jgi:protein-S-isoprenylcysteine O-methyltransferase Ste14
MKRDKVFRFVAGYIVGLSIFGYLIPFLLYQLSQTFKSSEMLLLTNNIVARLLISIPIFCIGLVFAISSNAALFFTGKGGPTDAFDISISPRTEKLVMIGPYQYTRNPMVFGMLLVYFSLSVYLNSLLCLVLLLLLVPIIMLYIIPSEEKRLTQDFGEEFIAYKKKVPMLVPFTKKKNKI